MIVALMGAFALTKSINIYTGGGVEFEESHHLGIISYGAEYSFKLKNNFFIAPGISMDYKKNYNTWSAAIVIGKEF
jgi:hypothetical protein